jgi:peptidoglycan/xylan/chitin deacetylase (PgdA/CDA1 family)
MRRLVRRIRRWLGPRGGPAILMYHRIATPAVDPWGLSVSSQRFTEQVQALSASRTTLSMDSFVTLLRSGQLPHDAIALTFDDGYVDNLLRAKPILESAGVSATVFLATGLIGPGEEFWWDELARMVLLRPEALSAKVFLPTGGLQIEFPSIDPNLEPRVAWRGWEKPVTARERAYQTIWLALWDRTPESRRVAMEQLRIVFGTTRSSPEDLPMGVEEVRKLVSDLVSVGAHGRFHQPLTNLPAAARLEEMERSRQEAEALSALPVTGFAYPHGACNPETIQLARQAGFQWACSTNETAIDPRCVVLHELPRIAVGDWEAEALLAKLNAIRI